MGYDFCIQQITVPAGSAFPVNAEGLFGDEPLLASVEVDDPDRFWAHLAIFPEMRRNGSYWRCDGIKFPGSGFDVDPVHDHSADSMEKITTWAQEFGAGSLSVDQLDELVSAETRRHALLGIKLDMTGSWYDVLDLYKHMKKEFPLLVILDAQTLWIHDESAFLSFLEESNAK